MYMYFIFSNFQFCKFTIYNANFANRQQMQINNLLEAIFIKDYINYCVVALQILIHIFTYKQLETLYFYSQATLEVRTVYSRDT